MQKPRTTLGQITEFAERRAGIDGWKVFNWKAVEGGSICTGIVPAGVYSRGPKKGRPRFKEGDPCTRRQVVVSDSEIVEFLLKREAETGVCSDCAGTKQVFKSWHRDHGTSYKPCSRCNGTGLAPRVEPVEA